MEEKQNRWLSPLLAYVPFLKYKEVTAHHKQKKEMWVCVCVIGWGGYVTSCGSQDVYIYKGKSFD